MTPTIAFRCPQLLHIVLFATTFLLFSTTSHATDSISLLHNNSSSIRQHVASSHQKFRKTVSLNENGDLVIRCGKGIITMAYASPEDETVKRRGVVLASASQEYPAINGISVRLSLMF